MEGICGICYQHSQLYHVSGFEVLSCSRCSEQLDNKKLMSQDNLPTIMPDPLPAPVTPQQRNKGSKEAKIKVPVPLADIEAAIQRAENDFFEGLCLCPFCSRSFTKKITLINHIRHHGAARKYVCDYCRKGFTQAANLRNHERIHRNERPHICSDCGKAFTQITNLNNHRRLHTGERPFVCLENDCGRSFAQVTNLNNHMKTHHKVQQYVCIHCPSKFSQVSQLNVHMASHEGFEGLRCPQCPEKEFKQPGQLQHHLRQHGVEFPYACTLCEEKFLQSVHLEKHMKVHQDAAFKCNMCSSSFNEEAALKKHHQLHVNGRLPVVSTAVTRRNPKRAKETADSQNGSAESNSCFYNGCDFSFSHKEMLNDHLRDMHGHLEKDFRVKQELSDPTEQSNFVFVPEYQNPPEPVPSTSRPRGRPRKSNIIQAQMPEVGHFMEMLPAMPEGHRNDRPEIFSCKFCSHSFKSQAAFIKHEKRFHS